MLLEGGNMTDRALLFLVSGFIVIGALGLAIWLGIAGQLGTFDGNFLLLSALVIVTAFMLYLKFLIRQALEAVEKKKVAEAPQRVTTPQRVTAPSVSAGELVR
jgi:hypothetical protein